MSFEKEDFCDTSYSGVAGGWDPLEAAALEHGTASLGRTRHNWAFCKPQGECWGAGNCVSLAQQPILLD